MKLNQQGWIPGPEEGEEQFLSRVKELKHFFSYPPEDVDKFLTDTDWSGACAITERLYGFSPNWIVAHYSNAKLSFFQGAATWIIARNGLRIPLIQLKEKFENGSLHKMYLREEVLAHEAVHAARMQFDEPVFEEFFAYKTSPHWWRRIFGPIFERTWEAYLFIILLMIPLAIEVARFFYPDIWVFPYFLPFIFFGLLLLRLIFLHLTLALAMRKMAPFLKDRNKKWAAALFLKDREIFQFAYSSKPIQQNDFRWKNLSESYFKK